MLKESWPNIFWSSGANHIIDLMLEGIEKLTKYKSIIKKAKIVKIFLYPHHSTLTMMLSFINRRELVRLGITKFSTTFFSLSCLIDKSHNSTMVSSIKWAENRWLKIEKGKSIKSTIYFDIFWRDTRELLKIYTLLFKLLMIIDVDRRPSMAFVYGMFEDTKNNIKITCSQKES